MNPEHVELLERLTSYEVTEPNAEFPFSVRLARDNGWSGAHTQRAIKEYKRFAFLAVVAGHPVSPSEAVDQVWHEHLIYTQTYWKDFCGQVLRTPLHHHPTKGGTAEGAKFREWYARTLASYEQFFGESAPGDIWPDPRARFASKERFCRVNLNHHWVIPKPRWREWLTKAKAAGALLMRGWLALAQAAGGLARLFTQMRRNVATALLILVPAVLLAGCRSLGPGFMSPFDLTGESFLALFFSLIPPVFGLAAWLRWRARVPSAASDPSVPNLDPYAMAFLAGGPVLALNAAIASLVQRGVLETDEKEAQLSATARAPENAHPLERRIYLQVSGATPVKISELRPEMQAILELIQSTLKQLGLVVTETDRVKARLLPLLLVFALFGFGVIKIVVGLERNRPVGFLSATCVVVLGAGLVAFARRPHRTRRGDHVLNELRARHATLQTSLRSAPAEAITASLPLAVGLFGMSALADTPWSKLEEKLSPARCSSGCGGGAACGGGGGGCGGGCGGCGGG